MPDFLKGNFKAKREITQAPQEKTNEINEAFERAALKRLGGSIAFVSRKGFLWKGDQGDRTETGTGAGKESDRGHA